MSTSDAIQRVHIDIPPNEVTLTIDDIFGPVVQQAASLTQPGAAADPELVQHVQTLSGLITQMRDVIDRINRIDPTILSSSSEPGAST